MAGIYLHFPFCRQKCTYCNFFSVASRREEGPLLEALKEEALLRKDYLGEETVETIYFGGGTPSLIPVPQLREMLEVLKRHYRVREDAEITLEANPDDITPEITQEWKEAGINRLSIGVQSFFEEDLRYLTRVHDGRQSAVGSRQSLDAGFTNISMDLIYGMPSLTDDHLLENLRRLTETGIPHISAYALTVEPKTALDVLIRKQKVVAPDEEQAARQFRLVMDFLREKGYEHYEISNFCRDGLYSRHNSNYWRGVPYLGLGPSAHSYNGKSRQWNVASVTGYIDRIRKGERFYETEELTTEQNYNEYVMLSLRTIWGCDLKKIRKEFGNSIAHRTSQIANRYLDSGDMFEKEEVLFLTDRGKLFADRFAADFFIV